MIRVKWGSAMAAAIGAMAIGTTAVSGDFVEPRSPHLAVFEQVPRVPLMKLYQLVGERRLQLDLNSLSDKNMEMSCNFDSTNNGNGNTGTMICTLKSGDQDYDIIEDCMDGSKNSTGRMHCKVCVKARTDDFDFCYEVNCDFSNMLGEPGFAQDHTLSELESSSCYCRYAILNGEKCDRCEICSMSEADAIKTQLFSNLALSCPQADLVVSACHAPGEEAQDLTPSITVSSADAGDQKHKHPMVAAMAVVAFLVIQVGFFGTLYSAYKLRETPVATEPPDDEPIVPEEAVIT